jgi:hypothetical protein
MIRGGVGTTTPELLRRDFGVSMAAFGITRAPGGVGGHLLIFARNIFPQWEGHFYIVGVRSNDRQLPLMLSLAFTINHSR